MKDRFFWRVFRGVFLSLFALWLLLMGVLTAFHLGTQKERLDAKLGEAQRRAARDAQEIWDGEAAEWEKPAILRWRLYPTLFGDGSGLVLAAVYLEEGEAEAVRGQMAMGCFTPMGSGVYSQYLQFDPVLSEAEQLALAERLGEMPELCAFYGTDGGLYQEKDWTGRRIGRCGVVTGVRQGNVIYPQKLVYHYADGTETVMESESSFFEGKKLETIRFDAAQIHSALQQNRADPEQVLRMYRRAETALEQLRSDAPMKDTNAWGKWGHQWEGWTIGGVCVYDPFRLATDGLGFTYGATFLFLLVLALWFSGRQAAVLRRERAMTRAAAHALKTPAAVVRSYAEALGEDVAPDRRQEYLEILTEEADRMGALVNDLLDLSRMEAGAAKLRREPVALDSLLRAAAERLERPALEREIRWQLDLEPMTVEGDRHRLEQVADNLLSNALRHGPSGGTVRVSLTRQRGVARLAVENGGAPIPAEDLPRLFETFWRGEREQGVASGSGLGLALVREAVRLHGGRCGAENTADGVRFWVELPRRRSLL